MYNQAISFPVGAEIETFYLQQFYGPRPALFPFIAKSAVFIGALSIICQIMDGILTYQGVQQMGLAMEGNLLLRSMMSILGVLPSILFTKFLAVLLTLFLVQLALTDYGTQFLLLVVIEFYISFAILPWIYLIIS